MTHGLRLLLVDDDDNDLTLFKTAVAKAGLPMKLEGLNNGQQAIEYLAQVRTPERTPDVIILDLHMPLKSGLDFLAWRKSSRFASVPVVVLTGLDDLNERQRAVASGANLVLEKPLQFGELVELVRSIGTITFEPKKSRSCHVLQH
jgi:DNA-binding response OmpR family regulator